MQVPTVEVHVKQYAKVRGSERIIGLRTRIIINHPIGNSEINDFEYQHEAKKFIFERFGDIREGKFKYISNFSKYGDKGYKW